MNFVNTKISAADFPRLYPQLFTSYQSLMLATLAAIGRKTKSITRRFDGEVEAALQLCNQQELAAHNAYLEATAEAEATCRQVCKAADDELNALLPVLLQEKDAAQASLRKTQQAQFEVNQTRLLASQECCRELGLTNEARALFEQFQSDAREQSADHEELFAPSNEAYKKKLAEAFDVRNEKVRVANAALIRARDPHALTSKRLVRAAQTAKHDTLLDISWRRDNETEELRNWIAAMKQERLLWIESFLQYLDERELQDAFARATSELDAVAR